MNDEGATLNDVDIIGLRCAAAMAHTVGGITLTLGSAGRRLATVGPSARAEALDSCGFRVAVARAWCDHRAGRRIAFVGQQVNSLEIDWTIRSPGRLLGFGGVRTHVGGAMVWAMPSLLPPSALSDVLGELDDPTELLAHPAVGVPASLFESITARLVRDDLLGVSIVHVEIAADRQGPTTPAVVAMLDEVVVRLLAANAAAELLESVSTAAA